MFTFVKMAKQSPFDNEADERDTQRGHQQGQPEANSACLLYTSDAADDSVLV